MKENIDETDILVVIYPNKQNPKSLLIIDPFDKKLLQFDITSLDEAKEILKENLPFCHQDEEVEIHLGTAYVTEWESLPVSTLSIKTPDKIDKVLS